MRWNKEAVRAFQDRDWNLFERAPLKLDSARSQELAGSLYEQIRAANPDWPTPLDRDQDLAAHLHLVEVFARIHDAQRRRIHAG